MQRWITVLGMVICTMLAITAFGTSITHLIAMEDVAALFYTIPGTFIGTVLALYFMHEFLMTFPSIARFADAVECRE